MKTIRVYSLTNPPLLHRQLIAAIGEAKVLNVRQFEFDDRDPETYVDLADEATAADISAVNQAIIAHKSDAKTDVQEYETAVQDVRAFAKKLIGDLVTMPHRDAAYVGLVRLVAMRYGDSADEAAGAIRDTDGAIAYYDGLADFRALSETERRLCSNTLRAIADMLALLVTLAAN